MEIEAIRDLLPGQRGRRVRWVKNSTRGPFDGQFVLYWCRMAMRTDENPALDLLVNLGEALDVPPFVFQGLSEDYPWASDRHHTFMIQGARDTAQGCRQRGVGYTFHLERDDHRPSPLQSLAKRSSVVIVEDVPVNPLRGWRRELASKSNTPILAVDTDCVVPMRSVKPGLDRAYKYRNHTGDRRRVTYETEWTSPTPRSEHQHFEPEPLGFTPLDPEELDLDSVLSRCQINHSIAPIGHRVGGSDAGYRRWKQFRQNHLDQYDKRRNNPADPMAVSRLSPYLHYGQISPFRIARETNRHDSDGAEKFIDELITWREMAHYFCFYHETYDEFSVLPEWARDTLLEHQSDPREELYSWETLARAQTHDEFWNVCQEWYLRHGEMHNNVRMTWAKNLLQWTRSPERALKLAIDLNNRYALDGRDPNSYLGILWCFGAFDRPFDQDNQIIGRLRPRTTDWHANRTNLDKLRTIVGQSPYQPVPTVGIIGAGWAGISCARILNDHGIHVEVYEKSRGQGGRSATRYLEGPQDITVDHGAQYMTFRDDRLDTLTRSWLRDNVITRWDCQPRVIEDDGITKKETNSTRFVGTPTMNAPVKHMANDIRVQFDTRVKQMSKDNNTYQLQFENGDTKAFDWVLSTAPPEQSADIIEQVYPEWAKELRSITMLPTWCLILVPESPVDVEFNAAFVNTDNPIDWIARNSSKPGRSQRETWVIHANHRWSMDMLEQDRDEVKQMLTESFSELLSLTSRSMNQRVLHRWRYAKPEQPLDVGSRQREQLLLAGDWLNGSRVEGALLSGRHASGRLLRQLSKLTSLASPELFTQGIESQSNG